MSRIQCKHCSAEHTAVRFSKHFGLTSAFRTLQHRCARGHHAGPEIDGNANEQGNHSDNHEDSGDDFSGLSPENDAGCAEYHNTHTYEGENKPPKSELIYFGGFKKDFVHAFKPFL